MKRTIVLGSVACALLAGAVAFGKTNSLSGPFDTGDGSVNTTATIDLKIKTNANGKPQAAKGIEVENLYYRCIESGTTGELDFAVPGLFKIEHDDTTTPPSLYFSDVVTEGDREYRVFGKVNKKGTKVEGEILITFGTAPDICGNAVGGFVAQR